MFLEKTSHTTMEDALHEQYRENLQQMNVDSRRESGLGNGDVVRKEGIYKVCYCGRFWVHLVGGHVPLEFRLNCSHLG